MEGGAFLFSMHQRSGDIVFLGCRLFLFLRFDVWRGSGGCHIVADDFDWAGCRFLLGWQGNMRRVCLLLADFLLSGFAIVSGYPIRYVTYSEGWYGSGWKPFSTKKEEST